MSLLISKHISSPMFICWMLFAPLPLYFFWKLFMAIFIFINGYIFLWIVFSNYTVLFIDAHSSVSLMKLHWYNQMISTIEQQKSWFFIFFQLILRCVFLLIIGLPYKYVLFLMRFFDVFMSLYPDFQNKHYSVFWILIKWSFSASIKTEFLKEQEIKRTRFFTVRGKTKQLSTLLYYEKI